MKRSNRNVTIAKHLGARWIKVPPYSGPLDGSYHPKRILVFDELDFSRTILPIPDAVTGDAIGSDIPDYENDLNAMHEAEQALTFAQYQIFQTELCRAWTDLKVTPHPRAPLSAAASHRAEAFVRAIKELHSPSQ